jgi:hypothetical protein
MESIRFILNNSRMMLHFTTASPGGELVKLDVYNSFIRKPKEL